MPLVLPVSEHEKSEGERIRESRGKLIESNLLCESRRTSEYEYDDRPASQPAMYTCSLGCSKTLGRQRTKTGTTQHS